MTTITPTITTDSPAVYRKRLDDFANFAPAIHIDITDGEFAPSKTLNLNQLYWADSAKRNYSIGLHLMMKRPGKWLNQLVSLMPDEVVMHAECDNASKVLPAVFEHLQKFSIRVGVALLPDTTVDEASELIGIADTVLIFGGHLGYQGGTADLAQLAKVEQIRQIKPDITIAWDGGANIDNIRQIADAGVDQINVGSAISSADDAMVSYDELLTAVASVR